VTSTKKYNKLIIFVFTFSGPYLIGGRKKSFSIERILFLTFLGSDGNTLKSIFLQCGKVPRK
jgi:hypothetical protein